MKKVLTLFLTAAILFALAGCNTGDTIGDIFQGDSAAPSAATTVSADPAADTSPSETWTPEKAEADAVYQTSYFGVTVTLPAGYYIQSKNDFNFSTDPAATDAIEKLDYSSYDGYAYFYLASLSSGEDINDRDTAELALWIEQDTYYDFGEFVDDCQDYYQNDSSYTEEGWNISYEGEAMETIGGMDYIVLTYLISSQSSSQTAFYEAYYITELGNHTYLTVYTSYWKNNLVGQMEAEQLVEKLVAVDPGAFQGEPVVGNVA